MIFLSGGVDSVLNMLLAKSMGLPAKYVHIYEDKNTTAYIRHLRKRFKLDIALFLHEYSKNTFDCDGFDLLPEKHKEWLRNDIVNEIDQLLRLN